MLLDPQRLQQRFGGAFANLGMGSATAWEQAQLMDLFARHTPRPKTVIVAIDVTWCSPERAAPLTDLRPFPPWQYDENPWNDYLYLLNTRSLVHAARQLATMLRILPPQFRDDGYFQFVPDDSQWSAERAERELYGAKPAAERPRYAPIDIGEKPSDWTYPDLAMLREALERLGPETTKVLMFPPYHVSLQTSEAAQRQYGFCKQAVTRLAGEVPGTTVVDFMRPTILTLADANYWDPLHYRIAHAAEIEAALAAAVLEGQDEGALFRVLARPAVK